MALYFLARLVTQRGYAAYFPERLGFQPKSLSRTAARPIWLHAVSVGEVLSAAPLLRELSAELPEAPIYLSTSTVTGRRAASRAGALRVDGVFYAPLDYVFCVRRTLRRIRPSLVIVMETEIWPNLYAEIKRSGACLAIVNGRISDRTWPRYRFWCKLFRPVLQLPDLISVQSAVDVERFSYLGAPPSKLSIESNLKYDTTMAPPADSPLDTFGAEQVWIAASTVGPNERVSLSPHRIDEDDIVLSVFQKLAADFPSLLLIVAPRQPARFGAVAEKLENLSIPFVRRTAMKQRFQPFSLPAVLLLDTVGELAGIYSKAHVVFVGGSIAPRGGHNIIEPAAAGAPVVVGPNMQNFAAVAADFLAEKAIVQIPDGEHLEAAVRELLLNSAHARQLGARARRVVETRRGAARRLAPKLLSQYHCAHFVGPRGVVWRSFLGALAFVWIKGGVHRRRRAERRLQSLRPLSVPVISVGGITVGGSGKTPFATFLAERLRTRGHAPAILTRGYRRHSPARMLVFGRGSKVPMALTGDEAQIFLRHGAAAVGIGADRYETAQLVLDRLPDTDVLLLDDGFQHARIARQLDIVLVDGLDPFGRGHVVPLGRLREPLTALQRADILVVTRIEDEQRFQSISTRLRQYNPLAPIFRSRLVPRRWRDYRTGAVIEELPARKVGAFCGLGNPETFWRTLKSLGLDIVFQWSFEDHHSYKPSELQRLAHQALVHGAELLVTTEKDRINCPSHLASAIAPFNLAWLEVAPELDDEPAFLSMVDRALQSFIQRANRQRSAVPMGGRDHLLS